MSAATNGAGTVRLAEIRTGPLSVGEVMGAVTGDDVGGTVVFVGTVRDEDHGRSVDRLDYSAHPTAASELERVVTEVAATAPGAALAALHRIGELQIGDLAVVVAVGCGHRGEAFEVGRVLIDRIKAEVPLWKRQWFRDGEHEWVGACD
jgi:molybdopterin synthase catalytic subunit